MIFNRISIIIVLSILLYACFLQAMAFNSIKKEKEYELKIETLNKKSDSDSLKINLLELECERLENEIHILSSILAEYENNN